MCDKILTGEEQISVPYPVLKSGILKNDIMLNDIADGTKNSVSCKQLSDDSIGAICKAFDELTPEVSLPTGSIIAATKERVELHTKLFKNEYMNDKTGDNQYEGNCTDVIDKKTIQEMDKVLYARQLHKRYNREPDDERAKWNIKWLSIGDYTNKEAEMVVRVFGHIPSATRAVFLIGGLHGDEYGGKRAVKIMKNYIKENQELVMNDVVVFVLNPANNTDNRAIDNRDPNRRFMENPLRLSELQAITGFISKLMGKYKDLIIISAHSYHDTYPNPGRQKGTGIVFPLYNLTERGRKLAKDIADKKTTTTFTDDRGLYSIPESSKNLRKTFLEYMKTNFKEMDMFDDAALYGELIYYIDYYFSRTNVKMIEFETPIDSFTPDKVEQVWGGGFKCFIKDLLEGKIDA
jgi:hypothetical protein